MSKYFLHLTPGNSTPFYWRSVQNFGGENFQHNLNLLAHAVGDTPTNLPPNSQLVPPVSYNTGQGTALSLQPFVVSTNNVQTELPIGNRLNAFLDDPLGNGRKMDLSLPFYEPLFKLGTNGGGWFKNDNGEGAFHCAVDFMPSSSNKFDVAAAQDGTIVGLGGTSIVILHNVDGSEFKTVYQHLDLQGTNLTSNMAVKRGQFLARMDPNGTVHLHFAVAVPAPSFSLNGRTVPKLWYMIDAFGIYDYRKNADTANYNYLPRSGAIFDKPIQGATSTIQWINEPLSTTLPIEHLTNEYQEINRIQVRIRRNDNFLGTFPDEQDQFLVWLANESNYFFVPIAQATDQIMELELISVIREAFMAGKKIRLEYRYLRDNKMITAVWVNN